MFIHEAIIHKTQECDVSGAHSVLAGGVNHVSASYCQHLSRQNPEPGDLILLTTLPEQPDSHEPVHNVPELFHRA